MTRGQRNRNPFDLRYYPSIHWAGLADPPQDEGGYCVFSQGPAGNPCYWGLRAGFRDLYTKWAFDNLKTIAVIVPKFAPPQDEATGDQNPTAAYIALVERRTGWGLHDILDLSVAANLKLFGRAFLDEEQGDAVAQTFSDAELDPAVSAALPIRTI